MGRDLRTQKRNDDGCFFLSQSRSVNVKVSRLKVQKAVYVKLGKQPRKTVVQQQVKMSKNCVLRRD